MQLESIRSIVGMAREDYGGAVTILANGPSLPDTLPHIDQESLVIAVQGVWKSGVFGDIAIYADTDPWNEMIKFASPAHFSVITLCNKSACPIEPLQARLSAASGNYDAFRLIPFNTRYAGMEDWPRPGCETREYLDTGVFPDMKLRPRGDARRGGAPDTILCKISSVCAALHVALLAGADRITLAGVDCGGGQRSFFDSSPLENKIQKHLDKHAEQLRGFRNDWEPRGVVCRAFSGEEKHGWPRPQS